MATAEDIAQVKQQINQKINRVSSNISTINNFTQSLKLAFQYLTTKITALKNQGAEGQQRVQELYEELNTVLDQLNGINDISPEFIEAINSIIKLANQEKEEGKADIDEINLNPQVGGRKSRKSRKSRKCKHGGYRYKKPKTKRKKGRSM